MSFMKKLLASLCMIFTLMAVIFPVNAEDNENYLQLEDSSHITQEILNLIPIEDGDQVVRIFITDIHSEFAKHDNIDELLNAHNDLIVYAVKSIDNAAEAYRIYEGECVKMRPYQGYYILLDIYLNGEIIKQVDPDIKVEYAYYFCGESNISGNAIYYKTNMGDYVYYLGYSGGFDGAYLLSAQNFFEAQKVAYNHMLENGSNVGGTGVPDLDLSTYRVGSANFNPNAPFPTPGENSDSGNSLWLICGIGVGALLVAGGTVFIILRQRKRGIPA